MSAAPARRPAAPPEGAVELAGALARDVVDLLRRDLGTGPRTDVTTKAHAADLLTGADVAVEAHVRSAVLDRFPDHGVVGEEGGTSGADTAHCRWWVDPVDGTTNWAHGLPWASFSLALTVDGTPVLGVVADPFRQELWAASTDRPATLDGRPVHCSETAGLAGTLVLTEWAAHEPWPGMDTLLSGLASQHCTSRVMGSSALSLASVAAGRAAGTVIGQFSPVDDLAGAYIAVRAGAQVLSADGSLTPGHGGIGVAAPGVAGQLRALLPDSWAGSD